MLTDDTGGTKYPMKRIKIEELKQKGSLELLILHPAKLLNRLVLNPEIDEVRVMYEIIIATSNARAVENSVHAYMKEKGMSEFSKYSVTTSPSRFKDRDLCMMYPASVRVALKLGVPFNYEEIIQSIPKNEYGHYYLSTPYNNGMFPITNVWYEIPEEHKDERNAFIYCTMSVPQSKYGEDRIEKIRRYDTELMHRLLDSGVNLTAHIGAQFLDHTHLDVDKIDPRYSVCIPAVKSLNKSNPIIPKVEVQGLDCLPLRECIKYAELVDMQQAIDPHRYPLCFMPVKRNSNAEYVHYNRTNEYLFACRIAKLSGRFTFYKTALDEFLIACQRGSKSDLNQHTLQYLCDNLLVQKIRLTVNDTKEVVEK